MQAVRVVLPTPPLQFKIENVFITRPRRHYCIKALLRFPQKYSSKTLHLQGLLPTPVSRQRMKTDTVFTGAKSLVNLPAKKQAPENLPALVFKRRFYLAYYEACLMPKSSRSFVASLSVKSSEL
jgi:hypothetical protein